MRNIDAIKLIQQKTRNRLHAMALVGTMVSLLSFLGWVLAGADGLAWALLICIGLFIISPTLSPHWILRLYGARPLSPHRAPRLYAALQTLAVKAALPRLPTLYYVPSKAMNAFAVGNRDNAGIALTDGLIRTLHMREINGVLAHEVSHLRHNDLWVLNIANIIGRVTAFLSLAGQLLLLISLPLWLVSGQNISWVAILVLILSPTVVSILQLALSRTQEFNADLSAAELTEDPGGLASALLKIEQRNAGFLSRIILGGYRRAQPASLRTHPETQERVRRLLDLSQVHPSPEDGIPRHGRPTGKWIDAGRKGWTGFHRHAS
jgi:heat shock protein HtpX